jgi:streptogramin lyase
MRTFRLGFVFLGASLLIACDLLAVTVIPGSLNVLIDSPVDIVPRVTVTGPNGFSETLNTSKKWIDLKPGLYKVAATRIRRAMPIIDELFDAVVTGDPAVSTGKESTILVRYNRQNNSGALWIAESANVPLQVPASKLLQSGTLTLEPGLSIAGLNGAASSTFDTAGNLWITALYPNQSLYQLSAAQLAAGGQQTPEKVIQTEAFGLVGAAFDPQGNLWVGARDSHQVLKFTPEQLATGGPQVASISLSANGPASGGLKDMSLGGASFPTFDANGNLWLANFYADTLVKFTPAQYAVSGRPTPAVTISGVDINHPCQMAFDKSGNLWVANYFAQNILKFNAADLNTSGSPAPAVKITGPLSNMNGPTGLAFDNADHLWVSIYTSRKLLRFAPTQLAATGEPDPLLILDTRAGGLPFGLTFYPSPMGYPLP